MSAQENNGSVHTYLNQIGRIDLLTRQEERELAQRARRGDEDARDRLVEANLRLVVKIAQRYSFYGLPLADLISEGNIGLMKAVDRFDPGKEAKLSTYAAWWIKNYIKRALANQGRTIRKPVHVVDKILHLRAADNALAEALGRDATDEELAQEINEPTSEVRRLKTAALSPTSLDAPSGDADSDHTLGDNLADDREPDPCAVMTDRQIIEHAQAVIERLDPRERDILKYRYGLNGANEETLETVGRRFNITHERVRQIQKGALPKIRAMIEADETPAGATAEVCLDAE